MRDIEECSADEILAMMTAKYDGDRDRCADVESHDLCALTREYITKRSAGNVGPSCWAHMRAAIGEVINIEVHLGAPTERVLNDSSVDKLAIGILSAVYSQAMKDCGTMLRVGGEDLEAAAKAVADGARRGVDVELLFDSNALRAAIQGVADNALPLNGRMLPRRRPKGD